MFLHGLVHGFMLHGTIGPQLSSSAVINIVSNILGGYWVILLAKDYSGLSVQSLSACFCSFAHCALWVDLGL